MQKGSSKIYSFTDLVAWQKAHELVLEIYSTTKKFPADERFGLSSQMRRSSASISANLAEGFGRQGNQEKIQFYIIARGSDTELQDQLLIARDLKYIPGADCEKMLDMTVVVHKLINGLIKSMRMNK